MAEHTPGPWFVVEIQQEDRPDRYYIANDEHGLSVAHVYLDGDAHKIAAAPELLDALEDLCYAEPDDIASVWERAKVVIAKAKGQ